MITRTAVGEFNGPAPLGSPCNVHGNEPRTDPLLDPSDVSKLPAGMDNSETDPCGPWPQFWPTIYGPEIYKTQGDQFATRKCGIDPYRESNCASGAVGSASEDFDQRGYAVTIKVRASVQNLTIQLYDPAYVDTGPTCGSLPAIGNNTIGTNPVVDALQRYAPNSDPLSDGRPTFCTGDSDNAQLRFPVGSNNIFAGEVPTITSFGLIKPTKTFNPFDQAANESANRVAGCYRQFPGYSKNGSGTWTPSAGADAVPGATALAQLSANNALTRVFHQWVTLCQITGTVAPGDYYLRVRSNVPLGASADTFFGFEDNPGVLGNGGNRLAVRAFPSNPLDAGKVSVSPYARMPIYVNTKDGTTIFNLIRVVPESAGANINFTFFDVGDLRNATFTMTVLPPDGGYDPTVSVPMDLNTACTVSGSLRGNAPTTTPNTKCEVSGIRNNLGYNGQEWKIIVPVPSGYTCAGDDPFACWWRLKLVQVRDDPTEPPDVTDQTTWTATLDGDPVRLVQ